METTNLNHVIDLNNETANCKIVIKLADDCKNGHQDFSITGTFWKIGKVRNDYNMSHGGCCHEAILKLLPTLKMFTDLHLCDYKGIPMYIVENGYYHLTKGFNSKSTGEAFKKEFCEYYRLSEVEFEFLKDARNKVHFAILLEKLDVFSKWEKQANEAIKWLETKTGNTFVCDSKRTQYNRPEQSEIDLEIEREKNGYYSESSISERNNIAAQKAIQAIKEENQKRIDSIKELEKATIIVLETVGFELFKNVIVFDSTKSIGYNWKSYEIFIPETKIDEIRSNPNFPKNIKLEDRSKK